jgi:LDH2 family malate/lactate/ureidoglycolate dehydrogenase
LFLRRAGLALALAAGVLHWDRKLRKQGRIAMDQISTPTRVPASAIAGFIRDALAKMGLPARDAAKVAELMTEADVTGADAHGVFRLPQYVRRLHAGGVNPRPDIKVSKTAPATALVDGDNGMGHLVMAQAAATAVELARASGVGWVGARRSNHAGAAGVYAAMMLPHGMIGIYSVVASANHMAMWGGAETLIGTNPLAIAIPAGAEAPVVLDIATTVASYGTVKNYRLQGKQMPKGWMISSRDGAPITDPERSAEGLLLPIGGYKGSGLALVLGLLAGTLNGASFGRDVVDFNADEKSPGDTGHFIIALDIARFTPLASFTAEVDRHLRDLRASRTLPGFDAVRLPGEERGRRRADRLANGVPVLGELIVQLDRLAAELGLTPVRER